MKKIFLCAACLMALMVATVCVAADVFVFRLDEQVRLPEGQYLVLKPGQSATILDDVVVQAQVPAQGNPLFSGPVRLRRGTVVLAPVVEN